MEQTNIIIVMGRKIYMKWDLGQRKLVQKKRQRGDMNSCTFPTDGNLNA